MIVSASAFFGNFIICYLCIYLVYLVAFAMELYMGTFIPFIIYERFSIRSLITEPEFYIYSGVNTAVNILCILAFIIYISDVNVDDVTVSKNENSFGQSVDLK